MKDVELLNYVTISYVGVRCPWQVFQRRVDDTTDFYLDWKSYKEGFGDLMQNFWLGGSTLLNSGYYSHSLICLQLGATCLTPPTHSPNIHTEQRCKRSS